MNNKINEEKEDIKINEEKERQLDYTDFTIDSPMGKISVDLKEFEQARKNAKKQLNPPEVNYMRRKIREFLDADDKTDFKYFGNSLGPLVKLYMDDYFSKYELVKEFMLEGTIEIEAAYSSVTLYGSKSKRFLQSGVRFYANDTEKFVIVCAVDPYDGDQKISIITGNEGRGLELIEELENSFYKTGPLKGAFFDMEYNFINRSEVVNQLIAWNDDVKNQLDKDVIEFLKVMPILRENSLPNSRGIILSGPPGTGKTMMAKSLAAQANVTTILVSAEMIKQKNQIKTAFKIGRKLAPTLMIIEDIDTAGTVSRKFTDHPILGEYLQAMDGMEPNDGMVILATTNHTENIDPAISDRPGRFDRIIEVPLPNSKQRQKIIKNILAKMPAELISKSVLSEVVSKSEGLSGAWVRELVQSAFIEAIYQGRDKLNSKDLQTAVNDILKRRGMAYHSTQNLSHRIDARNAELYTM
tara:strand:- start:332 stop:1738 length:1407 start_codon:yes stop_codon:yes gene_type:complete